MLSLLVRGRTTLRIAVAVIASPASEHAKGQESREYLDSNGQEHTYLQSIHSAASERTWGQESREYLDYLAP